MRAYITLSCFLMLRRNEGTSLCAVQCLIRTKLSYTAHNAFHRYLPALKVPSTKSTAFAAKCHLAAYANKQNSGIPLLVSLGELAAQHEDVLGRHQVVLCWLVPVFICLLAAAAKANKVGSAT